MFEAPYDVAHLSLHLSLARGLEVPPWAVSLSPIAYSGQLINPHFQCRDTGTHRHRCAFRQSVIEFCCEQPLMTVRSVCEGLMHELTNEWTSPWHGIRILPSDTPCSLDLR